MYHCAYPKFTPNEKKSIQRALIDTRFAGLPPKEADILSNKIVIWIRKMDTADGRGNAGKLCCDNCEKKLPRRNGIFFCRACWNKHIVATEGGIDFALQHR